MPNQMLPMHQIGGAYVRRRCTIGGVVRIANSAPLTGDEVRAIPPANLKAFVSIGTLELYPLPPLPPDMQRFCFHMGMGKFDVIEGYKLNPQPLTRAEAEGLLPPDQKPKGRRKPKAGKSK